MLLNHLAWLRDSFLALQGPKELRELLDAARELRMHDKEVFEKCHLSYHSDASWPF